MILITGGVGFIGSNFVLDWLSQSNERIINVDLLTYADNLENLDEAKGDERHTFIQGDIGDGVLIAGLLERHRPRAIINFAAESHVDRSIHGLEDFIQTNIVGTFRLLEVARHYWISLPQQDKTAFRFLHVSTDEIYGSLDASNHLVRAYHHTYVLPVLTTNCSNNYGSYQFPKKPTPPHHCQHSRSRALARLRRWPADTRLWLYVKDRCSALRRVLEVGMSGEIYNIGGWNEKPNLDIVQTICRLLDDLHLPKDGSHSDLIRFVSDRPGHDRRYAIDARKVERELGWKPAETFETGIRKTVQWYLDHPVWVERVQSGAYRLWMEKHYRWAIA